MRTGTAATTGLPDLSPVRKRAHASPAQTPLARRLRRPATLTGRSGQATPVSPQLGDGEVAVPLDDRTLILDRVVSGKLTVVEAALLLGLSERSVWRLTKITTPPRHRQARA